MHAEKVAVVMDQTLYAKATEVAWKHKLKFENFVLMMGNFHIICNLLSIIDKLFCDAGLRELAVQSGVIAEGSIDKVLDGRQYNREVQLHKLTYEAMMRLVWSGFLNCIEINKPRDMGNLDVAIQCVNELQDNPCAAQLRMCLDDESCQRVLHLFASYLDIQRNDGGQLAAFWMMYIDLVEILLGVDLCRPRRRLASTHHMHQPYDSMVLCNGQNKLRQVFTSLLLTNVKAGRDKPRITQAFHEWRLLSTDGGGK